jgi:hypothetical protein
LPLDQMADEIEVAKGNNARLKADGLLGNNVARKRPSPAQSNRPENGTGY